MRSCGIGNRTQPTKVVSNPSDFIPIAKPWLGEDEIAAVARPLRSGWVSQGPEVAAFEKEFSGLVGAAHACAVSSCTTALHLALHALGVGDGDEVITVSHSFIATANAIRYCGALPVFVDIEPTTLNIDPAAVERVITKRTRAILCVHQVGMPCDIRTIVGIGRRYGLAVVEDAACAIGSEVNVGNGWEAVGKPHGDVACFSFHPRKVITTGDGGMLTTHRAELDQQFRSLRQHKMSVSDAARHSAGQVIFENYSNLGFNYRMTDIQAAVGRVQLKRLPRIVERRRALAARYQELLAGVPTLRLQQEAEWARSNWQSLVVSLPEDCDQRTMMQKMLDDGVATRRGIMCSHREPAYPDESYTCGEQRTECECASHSCQRLVCSEEAQDRSIALPLYPQMSEADQDRVVESLFKALPRTLQ